MERSKTEYARFFKALCDEKRIAILMLLQGGEKCACELLEDLDLTQSGLSYHMKILSDSGWVKSRIDGKWTHYQLDLSARSKAIDLLAKIIASN